MLPKQQRPIGISGLASYIPPYRVWLEDWCEWTDNQWPKIREVVGRSFRVRGPHQSMYTMAANAVSHAIALYERAVALHAEVNDFRPARPLRCA